MKTDFSQKAAKEDRTFNVEPATLSYIRLDGTGVHEQRAFVSSNKN